MVGRAAVPVAVQQGIDRGLRAPGGPDLRRRRRSSSRSPSAVLAVTTVCGYLMMRRLFTVSETALADVRTRTFRHIHDLSMLHQQSERRGSLVSRVTSDVDQITQFLQWGGVILLVSVGQLVVTTVVMAVYSWQLTLVVLRRVPARGRRDPAVPAAARRRPTATVRERDRRDARRGRRERRRARRSSGRTAWPGAPRARLDDGDRRAPAGAAAGAAHQRDQLLHRRARGRPGAGRRWSCVGVLLGVGGDADGRRADRVPVPGHAVHPAGADRHRGAQRGAERDRRLAAGARRARRRARRGRPGRGRAWTCRPGRSTCASPACASPTRAARRCCTDVDLDDRRRRPGSRSSARPAAARPRSRSCSPG